MARIYEGELQLETTVYFVRHAQSIYAEGEERSRGLTREGHEHSMLIKDLLTEEHPDVFLSSPYERAIATIRPAAEEHGMTITQYEDLRERAMGHFEPEAFLDAKRKLYAEKSYAYPGGESSRDSQARAVSVLDYLLGAYKGKRIAIGTHGDIMTLMMQHYDPQFDYSFWASLSMPDLYRLTFGEKHFIQATRLWAEH